MFAKKKKKGIVIAAAVVAFLVFVAAVWSLVVSLELELTVSGSQSFDQEYGLGYVDAGAEAALESSLFKGLRIPVEVNAQVNVDPDVIGSYTAEYRAEYLWFSATATRDVTIVDTTAPVITLTEDTADFWIPGTEYAEPGFVAYDEYDGDITHLVTVEQTENIITYAVADSSGNRTTAQRVLTEGDIVPPEITLSGEQEVVVYLARPYEEPGFTATDDRDGDITQKVVVEGTVDSYTAGSYPITYTVTDSFGNTTSVVRTVKVEPAPLTEPVVPNGKVIYLTFDDGPGIHTPKLLEILRKYNVKATFFVVNTQYIHLLPEMVADGHAIGVHTGSHVYQEIYADETAFFADFKIVHDQIYALTGQKTTIMRFPGGSSNVVSDFNPGIMTRLTKLVEEKGFTYFDWNVDSKDSGRSKTAQQVFQTVVAGIGDKTCSVVLQHDILGYSVDAVERIIQWGLANGYQFLPLEPTSPNCHHTVRN